MHSTEIDHNISYSTEPIGIHQALTLATACMHAHYLAQSPVANEGNSCFSKL